jgi:hypothetical protein
MYEFPITPEHISRAQARVDEMPALNNSITQMQATLHGFVGEEVLAELSNSEVVGDYQYDLKMRTTGTTFEVKTKRTTVAPKPFYEVSVAKYNTGQQADFYAFTRVLNDLTKGWFLGIMAPEDYYANARALKKGDVDGSNNFVVKADCWNLRIDQLVQPDFAPVA